MMRGELCVEVAVRVFASKTVECFPFGVDTALQASGTRRARDGAGASFMRRLESILAQTYPARNRWLQF